MTVYDHARIEKKWQAKWEKDRVYAADPRKGKKLYLLVELAYTSGDLHIGHWFSWSAPDAYARFKRMQGYAVLFPVGGFDAFGLPAENAAIKHGIHPKDWTYQNIAAMRAQFKTLGPSFDWDKEVITCDPNYYRWTQWLFLKFYERGLAYKGQVWSNWCPQCQTVLANEHVINGCCWRHDSTPVEQKQVDQWLIKITDYADRLVWPDKPAVDWPAAAVDGQNNWIGRKEGMTIKFPMTNDKSQAIEVFTTRPDTLAGATFIAVAANFGPGGQDKTKKGEFTGRYVTNPLTGKHIPVWQANYVTADYGSGAIMGVPAHDARDREFAIKYGIEIVEMEPDPGLWERIEAEGWGKKTVSYHLRDWSVSRRRYWAAPVPIIYCDSCGTVPVPESDLPVLLPDNVDYLPTGQAPLATAAAWVKTRCPKCRGEARREVETLDTYVDSAWYFFRYPDPKYAAGPFDPKVAAEWLPLAVYFGGPEHILGHTLYARFITKFFRDLGLVGFAEFALKRIHHGIILGPDGHRMSKSRGNVVNPDEQVAKFGADAVRLYLCFLGPHEKGGTWKLAGIEGTSRFLRRVWQLATSASAATDPQAVAALTNTAIKRVTRDLEKFKFNTAVAALMEYVNGLKAVGVTPQAVETLVLLLAPFAPHITEEIWFKLEHKTSVHLQSWPEFDPSRLEEGKVTVVVQVNGKVRDRLELESRRAREQEYIQRLARQSAKVNKYLQGAKYRAVFVPGKLINYVV